jgi:Tfp pilus assembly protein PilN
MIKINLAKRKQSLLVGEGQKTKMGAGLGRIKMDQLKELPIRKLGMAALVALIASYSLDNYKETRLLEGEAVVVKLQGEVEKIQNELKKFSDFEAIKKSVDADEATIKTKLDVIEKLVQDRSDTAKLLLTLSTTIQNEVWLTELAIMKADVTIKGAALDLNQISDFMRNLKQNAFFTAVDLSNTQQESSDLGMEFASFELKGKRR